MNIPTFTAHNIRLDDGTFTRPETGYVMDAHPWFISAKHILSCIFPNNRNNIRIADLGCLEGGYSLEFARLGYNVLGLDVRESNIEACQFVKSKVNLPNLEFVKDDAWNISKYGEFEVMFCCGLLYHLDKPKKFLHLLSSVTKNLLILQTHFSTGTPNPKFQQTELTENEGLKGRWQIEFIDDEAFKQREVARWSSWDNHSSFWIQREYLIQTIKDVGFNLVMEQFDSLDSPIANTMLTGYYHTDDRGTFIGIKT
jgi:SAM-dependent methyltransferase